ncbi:MAG: DUF4340 domain-containing protein [Ruminococcus sp.]|nr:DUF4340 domain-containing protein [Ruminococcus sp.]
MNSKLTGIIVTGVLAASLGGVLLFLEKTGGSDNSSSEGDSSSSVVINKKENTKTQIVDRTADDVESITVENTKGSFTLSRNISGKSKWEIPELEGLTLGVSECNSLADCAATLKSFDTVEEDAKELSKYGFDEPSGKFTVTFNDGEKRTFIIGDDLPKSDRYCYLYEEGKTTVYEVLNSYVSHMKEGREAYVNRVFVTQPSNDSYPEYGTLTVKRKDVDYEVVIVNDDKEQGAVSAQVMKSPVYGYLNVTNSSDYTHGIWGLTADMAEVIKPDKKALEEYGLKDPAAVITLKGDGYDYKLCVGNAVHVKDEEGNDMDEIASYYCTFEGAEGMDCIFSVSASSLPWMSKKPGDILSSLMTFNYIKDVGEIVITKKSGTDDIKLTYDSSADDVSSAEMNGKSLDIESLKTFYEYLLTCPTDELHFDDPDESAFVMKIEIKRTDGGGDTIEFYTDTGRRTIVKLNGVTSYRIESKWITQFEENIKALEEGRKVGESY